MCGLEARGDDADTRSIAGLTPGIENDALLSNGAGAFAVGSLTETGEMTEKCVIGAGLSNGRAGFAVDVALKVLPPVILADMSADKLAMLSSAGES